MKVKIEFELSPFETPDFVLSKSKPGLKQNGLTPLPKFPLSALDPETLLKLCTQFKNEIFKKAGKSHPPTHSHCSCEK